MPKIYVADIETDGLLHQLTKVHCIVLRNPDGSLAGSFADQPGYRPVREAVDMLLEADEVIGHNWLTFDLLALEKVYKVRFDRDRVTDTLILARVLWPDIKTGDFLRVKKGKMPGQLLRRPHSLEAWGYRLGVLKGTYGKTADWKVWTPEMQTYCEQDTVVGLNLWRRILKKGLPAECIRLEHDVATLCAEMTGFGWPFDKQAATELLDITQRGKEAALAELQAVFPPWPQKTLFVPKRDNKTLGYRKGVPVEKVKMIPFNPGSGRQVAERLKERYGWKPTAYTEKGEPQITEDVLESMPYAESKHLLEYLFYSKIEGFLVAKGGWLVKELAGFIHAEYVTSGAVTGRATHKNPNIAQVPSVQVGSDKKPIGGRAGGFGWECRSLFRVLPGWVLVGADQSGLELRTLSHYLALFDDGFYAKIVTEGDVHTTNRDAAGLASRAQAKIFIYAFLYGAGAWKLGHIVDPLASDDEKVRIGNTLKTRFLKNTQGLKELRNAVAKAVDDHGDLQGLDGRPLTVRKKHAALNTLLQSAGAVLCKRWLVEIWKALLALGLTHGWSGDFVILGWIHDEVQIACRTTEIAATVKRVCTEEAVRVGSLYNLRCATAGEAKVGKTWAETH